MLIFLLLLTATFKELVFLSLVPMWHTPDEQAHFAQVAYYSEFNKMPSSPVDLNREILESERLLGTLRDISGNNRFTYHPEYKIEYTHSLIGKYENEINNLSSGYRKELVKQEAANYPPLYYLITSIAYKFFYNSGLITRVFAARMVSILLGLAMVYFTILISKVIFPKNNLFQYTLTVMVAFQPMLSFVSAGVNSDNLNNLLFTVIIYAGLLVLKKGMGKKTTFIFITALLLLYLTKPQFIIALPIFLTALVLKLYLSEIKILTKILFTTLFLLIIFMLVVNVSNSSFYQLVEKMYPQSFFPGTLTSLTNPIDFFKQSLNRGLHETIPWYWGVFDWLGVVFPIEVIRALNRIMILASIGLFLKLIFILKKRTQEDWYLLYMLLVSLIYFSGILFWNYIFFQNHYFSFGLQGRYFFPTIVAHMALLLIGLITIIPEKFGKFKKIWVKLIGLGMISLNFAAVWLIAKSYYDLSNLNMFILQASQYKPLLLKGSWLMLLLLSYIIALTVFVYRYIKQIPSR